MFYIYYYKSIFGLSYCVIYLKVTSDLSVQRCWVKKDSQKIIVIYKSKYFDVSLFITPIIVCLS